MNTESSTQPNVPPAGYVSGEVASDHYVPNVHDVVRLKSGGPEMLIFSVRAKLMPPDTVPGFVSSLLTVGCIVGQVDDVFPDGCRIKEFTPDKLEFVRRFPEGASISGFFASTGAARESK